MLYEVLLKSYQIVWYGYSYMLIPIQDRSGFLGFQYYFTFGRISLYEL